MAPGLERPDPSPHPACTSVGVRGASAGPQPAPWGAQSKLQPGLGTPHPNTVGSARHLPPKLPAPPKNVETAHPPPCPRTHFPPTPALRPEPAAGPERRGPGGARAHKSPARSPCSSPSFSILPRSQVELGGLKRRVNEASVQNDSFLNQTACSVLGKWDAHLNLIHPPPAATARYLPT